MIYSANMASETEPRRRREPQNGVDFLTNYYAVLGVPQDADPDLIKSNFRDLISRYHPDKYQSLAPEFKERAEFRSQVIIEAHDTLSDNAKRTAYDLKLATWQGPISESGDPVIDLSRPTASLRLLTDYSDTQEALQNMLKWAHQMSGFDPAIFKFLEQQYNDTQNPSPELEKAYQEALKKRDADLSIEESFRREILGLDRKAVTTSSPERAYLELTKSNIAQAREEIATAIERTMLQLQSGEIQMLGEGVAIAEAVATDPNQALAMYKQQALERYDIQAAEIEKLAKEREEVMEKRLKLVKGDYLPNQGQLSDRLIISTQIGEVKEWLAFCIKGTSIETDPDVSEQALSELNDRYPVK